MATWFHTDHKIWLFMSDKGSSHGDAKLSGGFGFGEQAKLSEKHIH